MIKTKADLKYYLEQDRLNVYSFLHIFLTNFKKGG